MWTTCCVQLQNECAVFLGSLFYFLGLQKKVFIISSSAALCWLLVSRCRSCFVNEVICLSHRSLPSGPQCDMRINTPSGICPIYPPLPCFSLLLCCVHLCRIPLLLWPLLLILVLFFSSSISSHSSAQAPFPHYQPLCSMPAGCPIAQVSGHNLSVEADHRA